MRAPASFHYNVTFMWGCFDGLRLYVFNEGGGRINQGQGGGVCGLVADKIYIIPQEIHSSLQKCYIHPWMNGTTKALLQTIALAILWVVHSG